jgi:hypothetical protein
VALESYELAFGTAEAEAMVYFDFKIDALYLGLGNFAPSSWDPARYFFRKLQSIDLCRLQHIMIEDTMRSLYPGFDGINGSATNLGGFQDGIGSEGDAMENNVSESRLKSLVALTIISHGNMDIVIQKTEGGDGEFHTWDILDNGKPMPWLLAENDSTVKAMRVSQIWRLSELAKDTGATSLTTVRSVGMKRLRTDKVWAKRVAFLDQHILPSGFNACFYPKDGVLARVLEMEFSQPHLYDELNEYLRIDPEYLYISHSPCACPIRHRYITVLDEPEMLKHHDLAEGLLAFLRWRQTTREDAIPGGFPRAQAVEDDDTGPAIQSSLEASAAVTQSHPIRPDSTTAAMQYVSPLQHDSAPLQEHDHRPDPVETPLLVSTVRLLGRCFPSRILGLLTTFNEVLNLGLLLRSASFRCRRPLDTASCIRSVLLHKSSRFS